MKILYVVSRPLEINTSASIRNRATIMGLVENGNQVTLLTTEPDSNHIAYDNSEKLNDVDIKYIKLNGIQSAARIGRKFKFLSPLKRIVINYMDSHNIYDNLKGIVDHIAEVDINKFDLVISSSDPKSSHLFVEKAKEYWKYQGKWIQIWGDPFYADITLDNKSKKKKIYSEEHRLLGSCDKVVYVSKMTLKAQMDLYPEFASKMVYIPTPYLKTIDNKSEDISSKSCVNIAYCGDYASNVRNITPLVSAVSNMSDKVRLTVCGNSDIQLATSEQINILKRQPYKKVMEIEKKANILVHLSNLYGSQIPGKIFQYSGSYKPILFILDGEKEEIRQQFEKYNRYYFSENNASDIMQTIEKIIRENKKFEPVEDFSKEQVAKNIISEVGVI